MLFLSIEKLFKYYEQKEDFNDEDFNDFNKIKRKTSRGRALGPSNFLIFICCFILNTKNCIFKKILGLYLIKFFKNVILIF
jgi:hypothetical protein